jgi:cytochrome P450
MEASLLFATIARQYRLELTPDAVVTPLPTMTLRPAHGVKVMARRR